MYDHPVMTPAMYHTDYFWPFGSSEVKKFDSDWHFGVQHVFTDTYDPEIKQVSVVRHSSSYGREQEDKWEMAVFLTDGSLRQCFPYDDTVEGYLTASEVCDRLGRLKVRPTCIVDPAWVSNVPADTATPEPVLDRYDIGRWLLDLQDTVTNMHQDEFEAWEECKSEFLDVPAWKLIVSPNLLAAAGEWAQDLRGMADERHIFDARVTALSDACFDAGITTP